MPDFNTLECKGGINSPLQNSVLNSDLGQRERKKYVVFKPVLTSPVFFISDDLDMHVIYDVSHNIAKVEQHMVDGRPKTLLVHRKGSTRAFPPHHPLIPVDYQLTGNLVIKVDLLKKWPQT